MVMATPQMENPYGARLLTVQKLRVFTRNRHSSFIPNELSDRLRHHLPEILEDDAPELAMMFASLAEGVVDAFRTIGIKLDYDDSGLPVNQTFRSLTGRERRRVVVCAALHGWWAYSLLYAGQPEEAEVRLIQGLAWIRSIEDPDQEYILLYILSRIHYWRMDVDQQEQVLRLGVEVAQKGGARRWHVSALTDVASILIYRGVLNEAEEYIHRALLLLENTVSEEEAVSLRIELLVYLARIAQKRGEKGEALTTLHRALSLGDEERHPTDLAAVFLSLALLYAELEHSRQMIACYHEAVRLAGKGKASHMQGTYLVQLAFGYQRLEDYEKALEILDRAEEQVFGHDLNQKVRIALRRANIRIFQKEYDEAITLLENVLNRFHAAEIAKEMSLIHAMLGNAEYGKGNYGEAERYYRKAIRREGNSRHQQERWTLMMAKSQFYQGKGKSAIRLLENIKRGLQGSSLHYVSWLHLRAEIAEDEDDLQEALACQREAANVEREYLKTQAERSLQNARIVAEAEFLEREAENERQQRQRLEQELAQSAAELCQRQQLLDSMKERLRALLANANDLNAEALLATIENVLGDLDESASDGESSVDYLLEVDQDFFNRLRTIWPGLTTKQERLSGLIRAGLNSKQIGAILQLTPEGVKGQRKRLRKAMNLKQNESLEKVIAKV